MSIKPSQPIPTPGSNDATLLQVTPATAPMPPGAQPTPPQYIGKYQILEELGEGGMGRVYKALDPELKRHVAIKVLKPGTGMDEVVRFRGEAELVAKLEHNNIIKVFDIAMTASSQPYIVLEFIDGGTLDGMIRKQLPKPRQAAEMIEILARAVHVAHEHGIIHRDLKPANVLITERGTLKVSDFGLGKQVEDTSGRTQSGAVFGTPAYMAPEQASGEGRNASPATDVYSLGAILYEMLTGRPPFAGARIWDILGQVQYADPASPTMLVPNLPRDLSTICLKCLEKSPKARYASARELADDLKRWLNSEPIAARPTPWWERLWRRARRRPKEAAIAVSIVTALVAVVALVWFLDDVRTEKMHRLQQKNVEEANRETQDKIRSDNMTKLRQQQELALKVMKGIRDLALEGRFDEDAQKHMREQLATYFKEINEQNQQDQLTPPAKLAKEIAKLADLFMKSGNQRTALEEYESAKSIYDRALKDDPKKPELQYELSESLTKIGELNRRLGDFKQAHAALNESRRLLDVLLKESPNLPKYIAALAETWHQTGEVYRSESDFDAAKEAFTKSINFCEQLCGTHPDNLQYLRNLGRGFGYRGDVNLDLHDTIDADRDYCKSHEIRLRVKKSLMDALAENTGDTPEARQRQSALEDELAEANFQIARSFGNFANIQTGYRAFATAQKNLEEAEKLRLDLVEKHGNQSEYRLDLSNNYNARARLNICMARAIPDAKPNLSEKSATAHYLKEAYSLLKQLHLQNPESVGNRTGLADYYLNWARYRLLDENCTVDEIVPALQSAFELLKDPKSPGDYYTLAAAHALQAETRSAQSDPKKQAADREYALSWLDKAIAQGYRERAPEDIANDRPFERLKDNSRFDAILMKAKVRPRTEPVNR